MTLVPLPVFIEVGIMAPQANRNGHHDRRRAQGEAAGRSPFGCGPEICACEQTVLYLGKRRLRVGSIV